MGGMGQGFGGMPLDPSFGFPEMAGPEGANDLYPNIPGQPLPPGFGGPNRGMGPQQPFPPNFGGPGGFNNPGGFGGGFGGGGMGGGQFM